MKDRLEKFIKTEGLTPSRFAEIMGVQPSSISHILGGRNKPSYDFIEKFLSRFPKVNPDWLILGKGQIYRQQPGESQISNSQRVQLFPEEAIITNETGTDLFNIPQAESNQPPKFVQEDNPLKKQDPVVQKYDTSSDKNSTIPNINNPDIERVLIFFKNKTFISYNPK